MPTRKLIPLPSVSNVTPGSQASVRCPVGLTYDNIIMSFENLTLAQIKDIELRINGQVVQYYSDAARLDSINAFYGRPSGSATSVTFWFVRPEIENVNLWLSRLTAFGTADVDTFDILFDIDPAAVTPAIKMHAVLSESAPLGLITKIKSFPRTFATAGAQEIDSLPKGGPEGVRIAAMHLFKDDITSIEIDINSVKIIDTDTPTLAALETDYGRVPDTGVFVSVDFMLDGDLYRALSTKGVQDFRIKPTITAAGQITTIVEYLDSFEGV